MSRDGMKTEEMGIERYFRRPLPGRRDLIAALFRQRRVILAAFAVAILAVLVSGMWRPKYEAHMKILVRRQRTDAVVSTYATEPNQFSDQVSEEDLNTEVELLNSEDLLREVVLKTGLAGASSSTSDPTGNKKIARAIFILSKGLTISPVRRSNVISVNYVTTDPHKAVEVLNALASAYLDKHMEAHRSSGESDFFDQQAKQYKDGMNAAQEKLVDFTNGTGVVSAEFQRDSALRQASDFDATAHQAHAAVIETEERIRALQGQLKTMDPRITTVVRTSDNAQLLEHLKSTLLTLQLKRTELLTKYEPTYRLVQEVDQEIADTNKAINAEQAKPLRDETTDEDPNYLSVKTELTKAQADLDGLKARATAAASIAEQYRKSAQTFDQDGLVQQDLIRTAKTQAENYLLYTHKREEARISDALDRRRILNVAIAEQPIAPAFPNRSRLNFALLVLLLTGTFSLTTAFMVDFLDPSFRTPDELASYLGTPVLASLPKGRE
jgi:uncharacterized protein involved in exopolysaccharide biosynthesis